MLTFYKLQLSMQISGANKCAILHIVSANVFESQEKQCFCKVCGADAHVQTDGRLDIHVPKTICPHRWPPKHKSST